jgi:GxxExxY protein
MPVLFHDQPVGVFFADLVVNDVLILELKAAEEVTRAAETQLKHYLRSCSIEVGLVVAFGERARFKRLIFTNDRKPNQRQRQQE